MSFNNIVTCVTFSLHVSWIQNRCFLQKITQELKQCQSAVKLNIRMDCCNYMEYRGHHLHNHNSNYLPHGYQLPYNQQPACFQSDDPSNYHTGGLITFRVNTYSLWYIPCYAVKIYHAKSNLLSVFKFQIWNISPLWSQYLKRNYKTNFRATHIGGKNRWVNLFSLFLSTREKFSFSKWRSCILAVTQIRKPFRVFVPHVRKTVKLLTRTAWSRIQFAPQQRNHVIFCT